MSAPHPCGVRHVAIDGPPAPIAAEPGERAVLAVFWWGSLPLGRRLLSEGELPVPASAVLGLAAAASAPALRARGATPGEPTPEAAMAALDAAREGASDVTVLVCTRDRPRDLARCLDALGRCDPAPREVIVVDNAPDLPGARRVVEGRTGVRRVEEPRPGLSRARNTGLAAATGEIVAFTDDDVEVAPNWLAPIRAAFCDPAVGCVTGLVLPADLASEAAATFEFALGGLAPSFRPVTFDRSLLEQPFGEAPPTWKVGAGANMALRRQMTEEVGPFDERLGAGAAGCSEDSELLHRALAGGWLCRYEPAAVVFHHHRASPEALRRQMRAYIRGHVAALLVQWGLTRHPGNLMRAFIGLPYHYARTGLRLLFGRSSLRRQVFPWECLGLIEGPFALPRRRSPQREEPHADGHTR